MALPRKEQTLTPDTGPAGAGWDAHAGKHIFSADGLRILIASPSSLSPSESPPCVLERSSTGAVK